jgi:hypothetical protein
MSTIQTHNVWQGAQLSVDPAALRQLQTRMTSRRFRGRLDIPGLPSIPDFVFVASLNGDILALQSQPIDSWPALFFECSTNSSLTDLRVNDFAFRITAQTTDAWLLHTRVSLAVAKAGSFSIQSADIGQILDVKFVLLSDLESKNLLQLARLSRKLKFLERVFNVEFVVSDRISSNDILTAEIVFRGVTQGEFATLGEQYTFSEVSPADIDLTKPPFDGAGKFAYGIGRTAKLLERELDVGPVTVRLDWAELASTRVADHIRNAVAEPVEVRFEVLDNQITHRFERYANLSRKQRTQELEQFKRELALEEPKELVDLVDEPLQGDVSEFEAGQIAMGWTFYSNLPDRYCPQKPEIDQPTGHWRVPIWLVYANGEGGHVGDVLIHKKTGVIVSHTSIEELRSKGLALAETILHAG